MGESILYKVLRRFVLGLALLILIFVLFYFFLPYTLILVQIVTDSSLAVTITSIILYCIAVYLVGYSVEVFLHSVVNKRKRRYWQWR